MLKAGVFPMFARNVGLRLRPNSLNEFKRILDSQIIPLLHKQPGFKDLVTFAVIGGTDVTAISLWETREHAEAYHTASYASVMKMLDPLLDGNPKLRLAHIVSSTFHKLADSAAA
jgi:heme-degrading monooxygenase HmoA